MDELKKLSNNQYAYLRQFSVSRLLELLTSATASVSYPEDETYVDALEEVIIENEAYVDALEEVIIEKETENPTGFFPDVDQQWKQFVNYYLSDLEDITLEPERTEHAVSAQTK